MLLTDDAAARLAADRLGIVAHGTLGLILRSVRRDLRSTEQALKLLADNPQRSSLHIRPKLLEQTVRRAEAEWLGTK
jgi:predicted nucleic acid-binding protein